MKHASILSKLGCVLVLVPCLSLAEDGPDVGASSAAQSAADVIRESAGTDGAFLAAGILKRNFQRENLASMLQYPSNNIVVLSLSGVQIRAAFERSASLYPSPNEGFLQISGFEVTFKKNGPPNGRIVNISVSGAKFDESKNYTIAMPSTLAHGGLGYFKIWQNAKTVKVLDRGTVEDILKGKRAADTSSRWISVP